MFYPSAAPLDPTIEGAITTALKRGDVTPEEYQAMVAVSMPFCETHRQYSAVLRHGRAYCVRCAEAQARNRKESDR